TLTSPCPQCDGVVKENYRRYACTGANGEGEGCGFSFTKSPAGRTFETHEAETLLRERRIGPLEGFRSKAGWPFASELAIVTDKETGQFKLEFDFGDDKAGEASGEIVDFTGQTSLGACPACGAPVFAHGSNYVCSKAVPTAAQPAPNCSFKSGQVILQQPIAPEQMQKLLATGKTDLLDKFVSNRTRRTFKAHLVWDKAGSKVGFEFEQRESKYPARAAKTVAATAGKTSTSTVKTSKTSTKKAVPARKTAAANYRPDAALAAVIGSDAVARTEALKKLWDYIKAHNLQDPQDKRTIVADDKLRAVLGKDRAGMFELTGLIGPHLVANA
ncbi:MAG: topoisomerase C-terminal repeat-containing protein, partial [Comamonas sp.]|nr:topoisomerase C-terminal repeat-containing protein [Comamonas sp.]